ncbi:MAG: ABC transporter ATP-binding protein, partial [Solobacterium sp.]|nr:ABC transporter ATP-binding protein [Solobacterium sp.]
MEKNTDNIKLPYFGIPKLFPYVKKYRGKLLAMVVLGSITSVFDAIYPLFNKYALDHFIGENTLDTLGWFIGAYMVILIAQVVLNYITTYWGGQMEMNINHDLRNASFNHLQTLS